MEKMDLQICLWPDPVLKYRTVDFTEEQIKSPLIKQVADAMVESMYSYKGIGLAAPQVGIPNSIFVMDAFWHRPDTEKNARIFINPKIVETGGKAIEVAHPGEGCLSFPYDCRKPVPRFSELTLQWTDFENEVHLEKFQDEEAIVIQHEFDHLLGYLFFDRLSRLKRDMCLAKARKIRRHYRKATEKQIRVAKEQLKWMKVLERFQPRDERGGELQGGGVRDYQKEGHYAMGQALKRGGSR
jgi:peptide deformylase